MLNDDEQAGFLDSIARVQKNAARHLGASRGASSAIEFVVNLQRAVDKVVERIGERGQVVDCKPGCAYCCSVRVEATEPEVFRIARELKQRPAAELDSVIERLRSHAAAVKDDATGSRRIDCAFLDNRLCTIYEVRPSACRRAHSLSVKHCESFAAEIPQDLQAVLEAEALMTGTANAYRQLHLDASPRELGGAVLSVLTDGTAEEKWYGGKAGTDM